MEWIIFLPLLLFSVIFHEVAHGLVALKQGDDTALVLGRLTLNPLPHIDLVGSILFPALCLLTNMPAFGWAKPVPVNPNRFHKYRFGVVIVSLAGPATNLIIAFFFLASFYFFGLKLNWMEQFPFLIQFLSQGILLNLVLAFFNLIPIPPLDGSRILSVLLPPSVSGYYDAIEPYGFFILMALIGFGVLGKTLFPIVYSIYMIMLRSVGF